MGRREFQATALSVAMGREFDRWDHERRMLKMREIVANGMLAIRAEEEAAAKQLEQAASNQSSS